MGKSVAIVSLYPLSALGGGERYTSCVAKSIQAAGDFCELFARSECGLSNLPLNERLGMAFTKFASEGIAAETLVCRDLLSRLSDFDVVWVHQFLSSDVVFDILATVTSDQTLLFTNLGHEPLASRFRAFYGQPGNHHFVEISDYSAERSRLFGRQSSGVSAALWADDLSWESDRFDTPKVPRITSVGRVLPHKGLDVTVDALPHDWELDIVGPYGDEAYCKYLRTLAVGKNVRFSGPVSEEVKRRTIAKSLCLVASSCHTLYDGREIGQAELLGLVIFEACAMNRIPITSDIPAFREIMGKIGLSDFVYPSRDVSILRSRLYAALSGNERHAELLERANSKIRREYLWDDYWKRVMASVPSLMA